MHYDDRVETHLMFQTLAIHFYTSSTPLKLNQEIKIMQMYKIYTLPLPTGHKASREQVPIRRYYE